MMMINDDGYDDYHDDYDDGQCLYKSITCVFTL